MIYPNPGKKRWHEEFWKNAYMGTNHLQTESKPMELYFKQKIVGVMKESPTD